MIWRRVCENLAHTGKKLWSNCVNRIPIKLTKIAVLGLFTNLIQLAFPNESIHGKSASIVSASTYDYIVARKSFPSDILKANIWKLALTCTPDPIQGGVLTLTDRQCLPQGILSKGNLRGEFHQGFMPGYRENRLPLSSTAEATRVHGFGRVRSGYGHSPGNIPGQFLLDNYSLSF